MTDLPTYTNNAEPPWPDPDEIITLLSVWLISPSMLTSRKYSLSKHSLDVFQSNQSPPPGLQPPQPHTPLALCLESPWNTVKLYQFKICYFQNYLCCLQLLLETHALIRRLFWGLTLKFLLCKCESIISSLSFLPDIWYLNYSDRSNIILSLAYQKII